MLKISFELENPWSERFDPGLISGGHLFGNKAWECQFLKNNCVLTAIAEYTQFHDHAGLRLELGLLGFAMIFLVYDTRHWDFEKKIWVSKND